MMLTGRVTEPQADALKAWAEKAGLPLYQATVRALELGIAALAEPQSGEPVQAAPASLDSEAIEALRASIEKMIERHDAQADMLSQIVMRADLNDRLTQRALYAAGAAYAAALAGPRSRATRTGYSRASSPRCRKGMTCNEHDTADFRRADSATRIADKPYQLSSTKRD